jgi:polyphenol oxidase
VAPTPTGPNPRLAILESDLLVPIPWLIHGFSTRNGGVSRAYGGGALNLGFTREDSPRSVTGNRAAFLGRLGASQGNELWPLVTARQIHSDWIHSIEQIPETPLVGDGLITRVPGIVLAVLAADCLPVILADLRCRAIGVFHAGWRGTVRRIVEKGVGEMRRLFGTLPCDLKAAIGPGIHGCCYQVGHEPCERFESAFAYAGELFRPLEPSDPGRENQARRSVTASPSGQPGERPTKLLLDLVEANRRQLVLSGVPPAHISALPWCTSCRTDLLFSHRAEGGVTGRMMAAAGIRPPAQIALHGF